MKTRKNKFMRVTSLLIAVLLIAATATGCSITAHTSTTVTPAQEESAPATPSPAVQTPTSQGIGDNGQSVTTHTTGDAQYSIRESSYTAWVNTATLNVQNSYTANASVFTTLSLNDKVTVTGSVLKDGKDTGLSRVTLQNGKTGYVSTQSLTTKEPQSTTTQSSPVTQTGSSVTLYTVDGSAVVLYGYTDGSWRTSKGTAYSACSNGTWQSTGGNVLYTSKPATHTQQTVYKTGVSFPLYFSDGTSVKVYEYSDGTYRDKNGTYYHKYNAGQWQRSDGTLLYLDDPTPAAPYQTGVSFPLYYSWGEEVMVYEYSDGSYWDDCGNSYHKYNAGQWQRSDGTLLYLDDPTPAAPYQTGVSFPLYYSWGEEVMVYEYSDGSYWDDCGNSYHKYNAGMWECSTGELLGLEAPEYYDDYSESCVSYESYESYESEASYEPYRTGVSFPLYSSCGSVVTVYEYSDGTYRDNSGTGYHKYNAGMWQSDYGELFGLEPVENYYDEDDCEDYDW